MPENFTWWECVECDFLRGGGAILTSHQARTGHMIRPYAPNPKKKKKPKPKEPKTYYPGRDDAQTR